MMNAPTNPDLAIVITARMNSTRLPGKALKEIHNQPLIYWIIRRLQQVGNVVLATTNEMSDTALATYVAALDVPVYRGDTNDVVTRTDNAWRYAYPETRFIMRGLGDCPFMAGELITRACHVMREHDGDAFVWALPPQVLPVYGSREFPYSRDGWSKIAANAQGSEREHVDMYFHRHRVSFNTLYHEPPQSIYFRNYRLEVDWEEDLKMMRSIAERIPMTAAVPDIIRLLDTEQWIPQINSQRVEITGPTKTPLKERKQHYEWMRKRAIYGWDDKVWKQPSINAEPVFCNSGKCLLGYADKGVLHRPGGDQLGGEAMLMCECGLGKVWHGSRK
jgi:spore coat polysaccharide biosynthesis protein SpsF